MKHVKSCILLSLLLIVGFFFSGCGGRTAFMKKLSIGMTKREVAQKLGRPLNVIDARKDAKGRVVEVWEYRAIRRGDKRFWVYFVDGELIEWHRTDEFQMGRPHLPKTIEETSQE